MQSPEPFHFTDNGSAATSNLRMGLSQVISQSRNPLEEAELAMVDEEETPMKKRQSVDQEPSSATLSHKITSKRSRNGMISEAQTQIKDQDEDEFEQSLQEIAWAFLRAKSEGKKV